MSGAHLFELPSARSSPVHRAPAWLKLALALALVSALGFVPVEHRRWTVVIVLSTLLLVARIARVPISAFALRIAIAQPFVLGVALLALFQDGGLTVFLWLLVKSTLAVAALQLLAHTTPFQEILDVLRRLGLPTVLVAVLSLLYRYLFIVVDESRRMRRARRARSWQPSKRSTWRALVSVIAVSFARSITRAERVAAAMQARGGP